MGEGRRPGTEDVVVERSVKNQRTEDVVVERSIQNQGMEDLLRKYNGDLYDFSNIYAHSAGDRDELGLHKRIGYNTNPSISPICD